jgi:hypothetical protein
MKLQKKIYKKNNLSKYKKKVFFFNKFTHIKKNSQIVQINRPLPCRFLLKYYNE